jgi:hypothetical protein
MDDTPWMLAVPVSAIIGGIAAAIVATISKARVREAEIRERIAMIERGLVPAPEKDPQGFERAMSRYDRVRGGDDGWDWHGRASRRYRSMGITLMGVGFGLMVLIGMAGESPSNAVGVGGFLCILGLAFFVNALFESRQSASDSRRTGTITGPPDSRSTPDSAQTK